MNAICEPHKSGRRNWRSRFREGLLCREDIRFTYSFYFRLSFLVAFPADFLISDPTPGAKKEIAVRIAVRFLPSQAGKPLSAKGFRVFGVGRSDISFAVRF